MAGAEPASPPRIAQGAAPIARIVGDHLVHHVPTAEPAPIVLAHALDMLHQNALGVGGVADRLQPGRVGGPPDEGMAAREHGALARPVHHPIGRAEPEFRSRGAQQAEFQLVGGHEQIAFALNQRAIVGIGLEMVDLYGHTEGHARRQRAGRAGAEEAGARQPRRAGRQKRTAR